MEGVLTRIQWILHLGMGSILHRAYVTFPSALLERLLIMTWDQWIGVMSYLSHDDSSLASQIRHEVASVVQREDFFLLKRHVLRIIQRELRIFSLDMVSLFT